MCVRNMQVVAVALKNDQKERGAYLYAPLGNSTQKPAGITAKIAAMPSPDALVHVQTAIDRELCTCGIATLITG